MYSHCGISLLFLRCKRKARKKLKERVLTDGITNYRETTNNLVNSISKSKQLYKQQIVRVHPDKFIDENKIKAEEISSRLTQHKRDYNSLQKIEKEIDEFLKNK